MKRLLLALLVILGMSSCYVEQAHAQMPMSNSCFVVADVYGERVVCTRWYRANAGVVFYEPHYRSWIGNRGYWYGSRFYVGRPYGYGARYRWAPRGYYAGHGWRGGWHGRR
jgi:hypothetical protein